MAPREYRDRIRELAERAQRDRETFEAAFQAPPADTVDSTDSIDEERALEYLETGVGPTVGLYIELRTREEPIHIAPEEMALLERAMNDWLALYARCYDVALDPAFTVREAAELLLETHNIRDTAQLLTRVPTSRAAGTNH